jgi:hypothetical protein
MTAGQEFTIGMDLRQIIGEMVANLGAPRSASEWEHILTVPVLAKLESDGLDFLKANGLLELFESSKRFPGFNDVQASWREAVKCGPYSRRAGSIVPSSEPDRGYTHWRIRPVNYRSVRPKACASSSPAFCVRSVR